ncbi:UDP-N-acetylglucosamine 2-epimerase (hydrolyzing) [Psychroflexus sp. YR1-1]|uniref:UDP-N-acetylglucosamine 2-epimerase (Hydrolyzing) n=1 Tax=Psychroflexus aurantiacus TaxID=2709310 RepID=A0A6B3QX94_9FLAO|nr:UDP-N-acetylglucosamine 2-epimerase [Psychroflexus aurantiacus]NEV92736.1 UDP-N-acetylglucosamine 2-epimerase (hydrolyzing) [Psychroflexus aurantiacus]
MKKICIITGTRAEYGLLKPLMRELKQSSYFKLQIIATAAHLSPEFDNTYQQIENDGYLIDEKVEMLLSADTGTSIAKSMGVGMIGYADVLNRLQPDALVILGDRYEMLAVALTASVLKIPIIHLHGGEITEGAYDDAFRHAVTKLSHLHFTSTETHRKRVIQMGEKPGNVYNVGAIGIDNIKQLNLLNKEELESELKLKFLKYNYQITFHPETLSDVSAKEQFGVLLEAIEKDKESFFVFTKANADTDGRIINQMINTFVEEHPENAKAFSSLGSLRFLSVLKISHGIIGNSSSGILEAPSLGIPTINIGDRQKGRTQAKSVINVTADSGEISKALLTTKNQIFIESLNKIKNPYGDGNTTAKIMDILNQTDFSLLKTKKFHDLN